MVQRQESRSLSIGKLAAAGGVGAETIRFYQRLGLLETPGRNGGIRRYGPGDVRRLQFIRRASAAGFSLSEIKELLELDACKDRESVRELARLRARALNDRIADLQRVRDALQRLAHESGSDGQGSSSILASVGNS